MSVNFIESDRKTLFLLPPSIEEWLPEGHLARFIVEIVSQLNLRSLSESYAGRGSRPLNLTDEESRIMPASDGGFEQGYNAQTVVDTTSKFIVSAFVTQQPNDKQEIKPALEHLAKLPKTLGTATDLLADSGYFSKANVVACEKQALTPYIAVDRKNHNEPLWNRFQEPPPLPDNADAITRMKHRLKTMTGKAVYALRKTTSEPVFGIIKAVMGFRSFQMRGLAKAQGEWNLVCMSWNLKRLHALTR